LLFNPNSVEDIANKIEQLISMTKEEREEWGKRSRSIATEMFSEESFVNKYIELVESK
jgi:glycosyltransferase involved in cell wall biosynthesis